jgi:glycosyltransferase involved in cell wall biosynthesis
VIPTFNCATTLPDAIASVRSQRWPDLEIIVVDDGSVDDTGRVLEELAGPALRVIRQGNAGPAAARNAGIDAARGEWVAFLDADDLWLPGKLCDQFDELHRYPLASFSYSDELLRFPDASQSELKCRKLELPLLLELIWGNLFGTPTVVVRRDCFETVGFFDTSLRTGEDWDMWLRLAACYEAAYIPRPLTLVRRSARRGKYPLDMLESCTRRVVDRLFSSPEALRRYPELLGLQRRVSAWHDLVIAKSNLHHGRWIRGGKLILRAFRSRIVRPWPLPAGERA